nr:DUF5954 family protein [Streptomyces huiliensis]
MARGVPDHERLPAAGTRQLNSVLWYQAYAGEDAPAPPLDKAVRRELLAAVERLETETVDDLDVAGTRYRVVRAEEYAVAGPDGIEGPRPTDPEQPVPNWDRAHRDRMLDDGLVLDIAAPVPPANAVERWSLRTLHYTGDRFPDDVRADSARALTTHPEVLLLPAVFVLVEHDADHDEHRWKPASGAHASVHDARKTLDFTLTYILPRQHDLIPYAAVGEDATTYRTADGQADPALAPYAEASAALRTGMLHRLEFLGTIHQICRTRRLIRWGPEGPEGPRPSDVNSQPPTHMHLSLDEDGHVIPEDEEA